MSEQTLGKARGLNSIADPKAFKGTSGRTRLGVTTPPSASPPVDEGDPTPTPERPQAAPESRAPEPTTVPPLPRREPAPRIVARTDTTETTEPVPAPPPPAGPDPAADRAPTRPAPGTRPADDAGPDLIAPAVPPAPPVPAVQATVATAPPTPSRAPSPAASAPHRAVTPGLNRKRRELTVPSVLAEALDRTGINPADIVMAGYRRHGDAIYAGHGGRLAAKGRSRLRLSISDTEFDQITQLGESRGWNRSETVSVILALELLPASPGSV